MVAEREAAQGAIERDEQQRREATNQGIIAMFLGIALFIAGIVATVWSYSQTNPGGSYFVFYGLVIAGAGVFLGGIAKIRTGKSD